MRAAQRRDPLDLRQIRHRQDARHDRRADAKLWQRSRKRKKSSLSIEQLRDHDVGAGIDLAPQVVQIGLGAGGLLMRFGISGHGDAEVAEFAADQADQFAGVAQAAGDRPESRFALRRIAAQGHDIVDPARAASVR